MRPWIALLIASTLPAFAAELDGSLDAAFGSAGRQYTGFLESDRVLLRDMAKNPVSGRVWLFAEDPTAPATLYLARLLSDGQPDPSFGPQNDGRRLTQLPPALIPQQEKLQLDGGVVLADGKALAFGSVVSASGEAGPFPAVICRLAAAGTLDPSFDTDGCQTIRSFEDAREHCHATDVAENADHQLVVVGNCVGDSIVETPFLARLTPAGAIDSEFAGGAGVALPPAAVASVRAQHYESVAIDGDGRILVGGTFEMASNDEVDLELGVARFDSGGSYDPSFNTTGFQWAAFDLQGDRHDRLRDMALRPDGSVLVLGESRRSNPFQTVALLAQWTATGAPDSGFDDDGRKEEAFDNELDYTARVGGLDLDAQGRALVVASEVSGQPDASVEAGNEFWFTVPPSVVPEMFFRLKIASTTNATGIITSPSLAESFPFAVSAGNPATIELPNSLHELDGNGDITLKSIHVTATAPVTVVPQHGRSFSLDTATILPVAELGTRHRLMSWGNGLGVGSEIAIVAIENGTEVTITPKTAVDGHGANTAYTVTLQQGEVYRAWVDGDDTDLTGTLVDANAPIGVFSGNTCAMVPNIDTDFCDLAYEQQIPVDRLGTDTVMIPNRADGDVIRILAHEPDTTVYANGTRLVTLGAGEHHSVLRSSATWINTSKPASVSQFGRGCKLDADYPNSCPGDPYMVRLEPRSRWSSDQLVSVHANGLPQWTNLRFGLVIDAGHAASITVDGQPLAASFSAVGSSGLVYALVPTLPGSYRIQASAPFQATEVGLGDGEAHAHTGAVLARGNGTIAAMAEDRMLRLDERGARDTRFGQQGMVRMSHPDYFDRPVRILSDGDGVLVGSAIHHNVSGQDLLLAYRLAAGHMFSDSFE